MRNSRMNDHLKDSQLDELKSKLTAEIDRIESKLSSELVSLSVNATTGDDVDSANDELMRGTELRFSTRERLYLNKLKFSLKEIEEDHYGMCQDCGGEISFTRLKARPTSNMCITCKEESEREEFQSFNKKFSKSLSNSVSM